MAGVLVADDHPVFRAGIARAITESGGLELVGEADHGTRALELIVELAPDVAIVDLRMPGMTGAEICETLRERNSGVLVLVLSAADDPTTVRGTLESGAAGYLSKEATDEEIVDAVHRVLVGETFVSPSLQSGLFAEIAGRRGPAAVALSENEKRVIELAANGYTNAQISEELFVSATTVKSYLARAFEKLGVSDRAHAAAEAMRRGLIS